MYIAYNTFLTFVTYCTFDIYITFSTYFIYLVLITHIHYLVASTEWVNQFDSQMVYERKLQHQVFYVIHVASIMGQLPVVPVGDTGTIPYYMRGEAADFRGGSNQMAVDGDTSTCGP